jgi:ABC-2 type transport system ATP-binding protein
MASQLAARQYRKRESGMGMLRQIARLTPPETEFMRLRRRNVADPAVSAVECKGLEYSFGTTKTVDGVDLHVKPGEVFGLLGPNGAGKTTTIRAITTLLPVPPGMISIFGRDPAMQKMQVRRLVGYVPQRLSADGGLTGRENVALFARVFDISRKDRAQRVEDALAIVELTDAADRMAKTYSGGMSRRLELAQALVSQPRLLILDEPTVGLDPVARATVWDRITAARDEAGMSVLVTTHYMDEAEEYCDRIALMHKGRIRAVGTPAELRASLYQKGATLEDVFRAVADGSLEEAGGDFRDV